MHQDYPLPPSYVIFAKVTRGMEVVDALADTPTATGSDGEASRPVTPPGAAQGHDPPVGEAASGAPLCLCGCGRMASPLSARRAPRNPRRQCRRTPLDRGKARARCCALTAGLFRPVQRLVETIPYRDPCSHRTLDDSRGL